MMRNRLLIATALTLVLPAQPGSQTHLHDHSGGAAARDSVPLYDNLGNLHHEITVGVPERRPTSIKV
jgi:hypothetical protein